jgi:hypothetical protein
MLDPFDDPPAVGAELKAPPGQEAAPGEESQADETREEKGRHVHGGGFP